MRRLASDIEEGEGEDATMGSRPELDRAETTPHFTSAEPPTPRWGILIAVFAIPIPHLEPGAASSGYGSVTYCDRNARADSVSSR